MSHSTAKTKMTTTKQQPSQERQPTLETLRSLIQGVKVAMLTALNADGKLRSRPMIPARHEFDGDLWFFAESTASQVADIERHSDVNIAFAVQAQEQFVSTSGTAEIVRDPKKFELLWKDDLNDWFPQGLATPNLVLIRVAVEDAEFWHKGSPGVGGFLSAMFTWKGTAQAAHGRIQWPDPGSHSAKGSADEVAEDASPAAPESVGPVS